MKYYPPKPKIDKRKASSVSPEQHRTAQAVARQLMKMPAKK